MATDVPNWELWPRSWKSSYLSLPLTTKETKEKHKFLFQFLQVKHAGIKINVQMENT